MTTPVPVSNGTGQEPIPDALHGEAKLPSQDALDSVAHALQKLRHALCAMPEPQILTALEAASLVAAALLWLRPDSAALASGGADDEDELRAFPSIHTCLVSNVVAPIDVLAWGEASRFVQRASIPAVYLSCAANFDRDDTTGEIFSYEVAIAAHQERCAAEAESHAEVRFSLDAACGSDWLTFFRREFELQTLYEVWRGDTFVHNCAKRPSKRSGVQAYPIYSLSRSTMDGFAADSRARLKCTAGSPRLGRGGCVVVFRHEPPEVEPFGMWFAWLCLGAGAGQLVIADLQNGLQAASLRDLIGKLDWASPPRDEVFFAPFRCGCRKNARCCAAG